MEKMLSFSDFEKMYESYGFIFEESEAVIPPPTKPENVVVNPETAKAVGGAASVFDIFKELDNEGSVEEAAATSKKGTNTLRVAKLGEKSDRVKSIQKMLGMEQTGDFDKKLDTAVRKFQTDNKLTVDGKVGTQTFGKMLEIEQAKEKGGITKEQADKLMDEFKKYVQKASSQIYLSKDFYEIYKVGQIITINGVQYVILVPNQNAKQKVEVLKKQGSLSSGFEWLGQAASAVGKALVYTVTGVTLVTVGIAEAMIRGAGAVLGFAAKSVVSVGANAVEAMAQVGKWVAKKGAQAWSTLSTGASALASGFTTLITNACKNLKEGAKAIVALAGALSNIAAQIGKTAINTVLATGYALGITAWKGLKTLGEAAKSGLNWITEKGKDVLKSFSETVKSGGNWCLDKIQQGGNYILGGAKTALKAGKEVVDGVTSAIGSATSSTVSFVKNAFSSGWEWAESLWESEGYVLDESSPFPIGYYA